VYDYAKQIWVLEDELINNYTPGGMERSVSNPDMMMRRSITPITTGGGASCIVEECMEDPASVEEHGLVLAIQAAHWHTQRIKFERQHSGDLVGNSWATGGGSDTGGQAPLFHGRCSPMTTTAMGGGSTGSSDQRGFLSYRELINPVSGVMSPTNLRPPSYLIIQMIFSYSAWCGMQASLEAMLPVWMFGSPHRGKSKEIGNDVCSMSGGFHRIASVGMHGVA